jgi:signal transduction histidine kinase/ligand-binding sensor domain-containing protein
VNYYHVAGDTGDSLPSSIPRRHPETALKPCRSAVLLVAVLLAAAPSFANAERLPVRVYSTADGLPSNQVNCVKRDSHGFLWFCTVEGLSRFDGYTFTNYGVDQGLPDRVVTDFLETRSGEYWVATVRGLARFNPKPGAKGAMFTVCRPGETDLARQVNALVEDREGVIWVGTNGGVFRLSQAGGQRVLGQPEPGLVPAPAENLLEDRDGNLWIAFYGPRALTATLCRRGPAGQIDIFQDGLFRDNRILAMLQDRKGRIWLGTYHGLALLVARPQAGGRLVERLYGKREGLGSDEVPSLFQSSDGRLWVGAGGVFQIESDAQGKQIHFKAYARTIIGIDAEDREGNFWAGATRIARSGFVSYGRADGLADENIRAVFEGADGALYVVASYHNRFINRFDGHRFISVAPNVPGHDASWDWGGWGWGQIHLQDHTGEWWIATGTGLSRYPGVTRLEGLSRTSPKAIYTSKEGLSANQIFRLYEDSRGDVWIGAWGGSCLTRWERSTGRFHAFAASEGWTGCEPTAFREDRVGSIWVGCWGDGLARFRAGHFTWFDKGDGFPEGMVLSIFSDHAGRLWAGTTHGGLVRIDDPAAERPRFTVYTTRQGLSSNDVRALTEDHWGRIYFWTGRGVDRLNPETGAIRHYTEADGLVTTGSDHNVAFCDRQGALWFGLQGLSRLDPEPDRPDAPAPPIRITKVRIRGAEYPTSELGETDLSGLLLQPRQDEFQIEFASLNFAVGDVIKYQYKLEGADTNWSVPGDLRVVNYPHLSPARYRFLVRAINADGLVSPAPAAFSFRLLPPVWRRWWFLTLASLLAASLIYWAYRFRLERLLELERVRTRIATDLHDDIGSSLTQIAIMSEVARQRAAGTELRLAEPLGKIADLSRELVDSMSDIVWAIDPRRDHLSDLTQRMRRFASDVFSAQSVELAFHGPPEQSGAMLPADLRRQVFLIFKESVNNVARHSKPERVEIDLRLEGTTLLLKVTDNGKGFDLAEERGAGGHGLASMEQRAQGLGGRLHLISQPGRGTCVVLEAPLNSAAPKKSLPKQVVPLVFRQGQNERKAERQTRSPTSSR